MINKKKKWRGTPLISSVTAQLVQGGIYQKQNKVSGLSPAIALLQKHQTKLSVVIRGLLYLGGGGVGGVTGKNQAFKTSVRKIR